MAKSGSQNNTQPVYVVSDEELKENGGRFRVQSGSVLLVYDPLTPLKETAGNLQPVYVVSDPNAWHSGQVKTMTHQALPISRQEPTTNRKVIGNTAVPVFVMSGAGNDAIADVRVTELSQTRITEAGDVRIIE